MSDSRNEQPGPHRRGSKGPECHSSFATTQWFCLAVAGDLVDRARAAVEHGVCRNLLPDYCSTVSEKPTEKADNCKNLLAEDLRVGRGGFEPPTYGFSVWNPGWRSISWLHCPGFLSRNSGSYVPLPGQSTPILGAEDADFCVPSSMNSSQKLVVVGYPCGIVQMLYSGIPQQARAIVLGEVWDEPAHEDLQRDRLLDLKPPIFSERSVQSSPTTASSPPCPGAAGTSLAGSD